MFKRVFTLILLISLSISISLPSLQAADIVKISDQKRITTIIDNFSEHFAKIKDAQADITLDYNLHLFGCSGNRRSIGKLYFKYPYQLKVMIDDETYFAYKNRIRKIDKDGQHWYVRLINATDFRPGFNPGIIPYNFDLTLIQDNAEDILIEGIPKPGVLKNVTKIIFHFDPELNLLRKMDLTLVNKRLSGSIEIEYEKIEDIWVPIGFDGDSAIELANGILVGLEIKLKGKNAVINQDLPQKLFEPGF